jgi:hypothetical protein
VGQVIVAAAIVDTEDEAARAAAAAAAAAAATSARCIPCGNGALVKGFHGDPERENHFWQYPEGTNIITERWDTYHAASFCSNNVLCNNPGPHKSLTAFQCLGHPPVASPPHVFYNGRCYRTLHEHNPSQVPFSPVKVSEDIASHAGVFCQLPQGFECCPVDSDSLFVCATFPWQSCMLIFAGDASYFTAAGSTWAASTPAGACVPVLLLISPVACACVTLLQGTDNSGAGQHLAQQGDSYAVHQRHDVACDVLLRSRVPIAAAASAAADE